MQVVQTRKHFEPITVKIDNVVELADMKVILREYLARTNRETDLAIRRDLAVNLLTTLEACDG